MQKLITILICALFASACSQGTTLPPITDGQGAKQVPGKFVWHNLVATDGEAARRFYGELLGWEFDVVEDGRYSVVSYEGKNLGGIVDTSIGTTPPEKGYWLTSISVPDVDAAVAAAVSAGGKKLEEPRNIAGIGRAAAIEDASGAVIHLLASSNGDPPEVEEPPTNTWLWHELLSNDPASSVDFYQTALNFRVEVLTPDPDRSYQVLWSTGAPRAGIIKNPFSDEISAWIPYIRVDDPAALASRVVELGGRVVIEPNDAVRKGTIAVVVDPSGAPLALQKWSPGDKVLEQ